MLVCERLEFRCFLIAIALSCFLVVFLVNLLSLKDNFLAQCQHILASVFCSEQPENPFVSAVHYVPVPAPCGPIRMRNSVNYPKNPASNQPKFLQPQFKPSKTVAQECREHGIHTRSMPMKQSEAETAVRSYTGVGLHRPLNYALRSNRHKQWENTAFHLNRAILAKPVKGHHPILWRGLNKSKVKVTKGDTILLKDFQSCSRSKTVAKAFAQSGFLLRFNSWKVGSDVSSFSQHAGEQEILLAPYQPFKVADVDTKQRVISLEATSVAGSKRRNEHTQGSFPKKRRK